MSGDFSDRAAAAITGAGGLVISVAYIWKARGIEDSLLADAVGASGVPVAVGALMALASMGLLIKSVLTRPKSPAADPMNSEAADDDGRGPTRPHLLALGLLILLSVYLWALPWLGYVVSIGLMAAAVAWLSGGRRPLVLLGFALCTGPLLWLLFDFALRISLPVGFWRSLL